MRRRTKVIVAALVLVAALAVALLIARHRTTESTVIIGGFRVSVLGVASHGKPFTTAKKWHPWAKRILPGRFQKWIPYPETFSHGSTSNGSVLVVIEATSGMAPPPGTLSWDAYKIESLVGADFGEPENLLPAGARPGGRLIFFAVVASFPRRDPAFNLKLLAKNCTEVGVLRVPNPQTGPFPVWVPRPLPQTVINEGVALTLTSLADFPNNRQRSLRDGPNRAVWLSPEYELKSSDPNWARAKVVSTTIDDATGNEHAPLPHSEPAWRIKAIVSRSDPSSFLPGENKVFEFFVNPADVKTNSAAK